MLVSCCNYNTYVSAAGQMSDCNGKYENISLTETNCRPFSTTFLIQRPRLLITSADGTDNDSVNIHRYQSHQPRTDAPQTAIVVYRQLGILLSQRCHCDVRIDDDNMEDSAEAPTRGLSSGEETEFRSSRIAMVVVHWTPPPADDRRFISWLGSLRVFVSSLRSTTAQWIGVQRSKCDTENDESVRIYHVYFLPCNSTSRKLIEQR